MLTPFQSFNNGQPVYLPVIWNLQACCLPVQQNSVSVCEAPNSALQLKTAQIGPEAVKVEEGAGLWSPGSSAFKTTKQNQKNTIASGSAQNKLVKSKNTDFRLLKTETSSRKPPKERNFITPFDPTISPHQGADDNDELGRMNWTEQQEEKLKQLVQLFGKHWKHISQHLPHRNPKQIRQRYLNYLRPNISHSKWTPEEDSRLLQLVRAHGHRWKYIEKQMKNRSQNQLKNRFYGHLKKQMKAIKPQSDLIHLPQLPGEVHEGSLPQSDQNMLPESPIRE